MDKKLQQVKCSACKYIHNYIDRKKHSFDEWTQSSCPLCGNGCYDELDGSKIACITSTIEIKTLRRTGGRTNAMEIYTARKSINSIPMNRQEYYDFRGWELPDDENGADEGYLVEFIDGRANTPEYAGEVTWSPKEMIVVDVAFLLANTPKTS